MRDDADDVVAEAAVVAVVDVAQIVDPQHHEPQPLVGARLQGAAHHVLELELVEQPGEVVHLVLLLQVGDEAREQAGLAVAVVHEHAAAAQPHVLARTVEGPVLHAVPRRAPVDDVLVGLEECLAVVGVHVRAPYGRRIGHHLRRQAELLHHGLRVAEHARLHVAYVEVVVGAVHQGVVQQVHVERERAHVLVGQGAVALQRLLRTRLAAPDVQAALLLVHALVGHGEHLVDLGDVAPLHLHDAEAEARLPKVALHAAREQVVGTLHLAARLGGIALHHADELVAREAEGELLARELAARRVGRSPQHHVALGMAEPVVDLLQAVDVEQAHAEHVVLVALAVHARLQAALADAPREQLGELVDAGRLHIGDVHGLLQVHERAVEPADEAVAVAVHATGFRARLLPFHQTARLRGLELVHGAERAAAVEVALQRLPAQRALGPVQPVVLPHVAVHVEDLVGGGVGDVHVGAHAVEDRVEREPVGVGPLPVRAPGARGRAVRTAGPRLPVHGYRPPSRSRSATVSMWSVWGNMSTGCSVRRR